MDSRARWVLAALWLVNFTASVQFLIVAPVLPRIAEQLEVKADALGVLVTAYAAAVGVFALIGGPVSDRFGRRPILVVGSAIMAVALLAHGLVESLQGLIVVRALAGVGGGLLSGATVAYIGDYFPFDRRGQANGWIASAFAAGQILGVPAGVLLAEGHFQVPFLASGVLMVVAVGLIATILPQPDVRLESSLTLGSAARGYAHLLRRREGVAAVATYTVMFASVSLFVTFLPTWLEATFSASGRAVASLFLVGGLANLITGPVAGTLSDRIGRRGLIVTANLSIGTLMIASTWLVQTFAVAYVLFFVIMTFVALRVAPLSSLIGSLVPARQRGSLVSLALALGQIGFGGGAAVAGVLYHRSGYGAVSVAAGCCALLAGVIVATLMPEATGDLDARPAQATSRADRPPTE